MRLERYDEKFLKEYGDELHDYLIDLEVRHSACPLAKLNT